MLQLENPFIINYRNIRVMCLSISLEGGAVWEWLLSMLSVQVISIQNIRLGTEILPGVIKLHCWCRAWSYPHTGMFISEDITTLVYLWKMVSITRYSMRVYVYVCACVWVWVCVWLYLHVCVFACVCVLLHIDILFTAYLCTILLQRDLWRKLNFEGSSLVIHLLMYNW